MGWIHRATLLSRGVKIIPAVSYQKVGDDGLHTMLGGKLVIFNVDSVVICAGQKSCRGPVDSPHATGKTVHLIGGCDVATELDARRAVAQGTRPALEI